MEVITLGELLAEFFQKEREGAFQKGEFIGPFGGGAPAIFADTISKLGIPCRFIGEVGKDDFGNLLIKKLKKDGTDVQLKKVDFTTGTSFVTYSNGSRKFIFHMKYAAPGRLSPAQIGKNLFSNAKFLHVSGSTLLINKSAREACYKAVRIAEDKGIRISFDPNVRTELEDPLRIRGVFEPLLESSDLLLSSKEELESFLDREFKDSIEMLKRKGIRTFGIKKGTKGSLVVKGKKRFKIPPFSVKEVDPTGAGDAWDAGFIYSLLKGKSLREAARLANAVGALSVRKRGGMRGVSSLKEVKNFFKKS